MFVYLYRNIGRSSSSSHQLQQEQEQQQPQQQQQQQQQKKEEEEENNNSNIATYFAPALVHWYVLQYRPVSFLCFDWIRPCDFVDATFVLQAWQ